MNNLLSSMQFIIGRPATSTLIMQLFEIIPGQTMGKSDFHINVLFLSVRG